MKITRSQLKRIIREELQEDSRFMDPDASAGHTPIPTQKKVKTSGGIDSNINKIIHSKFRTIDHKDVGELREKIKSAIESVMNDFTPTPLQEKAPPGKEDMVMALKKKMCGGKDDCPEAFATAWNHHNKQK
jgi:hypothetical protein|tara:strand:- start:536 stop:928 length:393 start_codon:yes stop_codon:yes gene_type:complete